MALRHGFTRLWVVGSALWAISLLLANNTLDTAYKFGTSSYRAVNIKPEDITLESYNSGVAIVSYRDADNAWIGSDPFTDSPRILEIETAGVTPDDGKNWNRLLLAAALKFNQDAAKLNAEVRQLRDTLLRDMLFAVAVPLSALVAGILLAWIARGFRRKV